MSHVSFTIIICTYQAPRELDFALCPIPRLDCRVVGPIRI